MSSRQMRRTFAAPLVVTLAVAPACTTVDHRTAPPPAPPPAADTADHRVPPPAPGDTADHRDTPAQRSAGTSWTVLKKADGTCVTAVDVQCHAGATCNPPAPQPYACPPNLTAERPLHIRQDAPGECRLVFPMPECPAGMMCNPPPPQKVACPS
jgi:hypothetical protein